MATTSATSRTQRSAFSGSEMATPAAAAHVDAEMWHSGELETVAGIAFSGVVAMGGVQPTSALVGNWAVLK